MKKIRLKQSLLIKRTAKKQSLVLDPESDRLFLASGDLATMMAVLFNNRNDRSLNLDELRKEIAALSPSFRKNKRQSECLTQVLKQLRKLDFLEKRP